MPKKCFWKCGGFDSWVWETAGLGISYELEDGGVDSERRLLEKTRTTGAECVGGGGYGMGATGRRRLCMLLCGWGCGGRGTGLWGSRAAVS